MIAYHRRIIYWFNLLLLFCLIPYGVRAQQGSNAIDYGQTVTGKITDDNFRVVYAFQGHTGDVIDADLKAAGGTLDPVLLISDDQNNLLGRDDDNGENFDAKILSQQLPHDGVYFLTVTRFGQDRGSTTGDYSLTLEHVGSAGTTGTIQYGDNVVDEINSEQYQRVYAFRATRGDLISAQMQRISGDLDALLILADADGNILVSNDEDVASPGSLDAAFYNLRVFKTGNYVLLATRFGREAGNSKGGFSLTLDRIPPEALGKVPDKALLVDYGAVLSGSVDADNLLNFYMIQAHKGDVITITAERTSGNLDPVVFLYAYKSDELQQLSTNDNSSIRGQMARISAYTVTADGNYILLVTRFNRDTGITAGDYKLSVVGRTGVTVGADGQATLQYGGAVSAIVSDGNAEQHYNFTAAAGDIVSISMDITSGNLLAQLILLDPTGKQVALDDRGFGNAKLPNIKLEGAGKYTVIATRRGRENGKTEGTYILTLTKN